MGGAANARRVGCRFTETWAKGAYGSGVWLVPTIAVRLLCIDLLERDCSSTRTRGVWGLVKTFGSHVSGVDVGMNITLSICAPRDVPAHSVYGQGSRTRLLCGLCEYSVSPTLKPLTMLWAFHQASALNRHPRGQEYALLCGRSEYADSAASHCVSGCRVAGRDPYLYACSCMKLQ